MGATANVDCCSSQATLNSRICLHKVCCCHTGEGAGLNTGQPKAAQILNIDIPFDGLGLISIPASETISPVYTMWITLIAMYTGKDSSCIALVKYCGGLCVFQADQLATAYWQSAQHLPAFV